MRRLDAKVKANQLYLGADRKGGVKPAAVVIYAVSGDAGTESPMSKLIEPIDIGRSVADVWRRAWDQVKADEELG